MNKKNAVPIESLVASTSEDINEMLNEETFEVENAIHFDLRVLRYQLGDQYNAERHLFFKANAANNKSLIVANVPPFITLDSLKLILLEVIPIEPHQIISRSSNPTVAESYYTATAYYKSVKTVNEVLKCCESLPIINLSQRGIKILFYGVKAYAARYRDGYKSVLDLQNEVDNFMSAYDAQEMEKKKKQDVNTLDEEGWITVTKSRRKAVPPAVVVKDKNELASLKRKKKKNVDSVAFYSHQLKKAKMKDKEELVRKFEEDKKKIAARRAERKFRPL